MRFASMAVRSFACLVILLATSIPVPVSADITATYSAPHNSSATLIVEVSDNGDFRAGGRDDGYELWSHGVGYEVQAGPGGPLVMATKDIEAARSGKVPASTIREPWVPVGKARIAGFAGTRYKIRGAENNSEAASMVISTDASLSTLGAAFRRLQAIQQATFPGDVGPERESLKQLLSKGAPLDFYDWALVSVSRAPIAPSRFRVPAAPLSPAEVADFWRTPPSPTALTPEDMKRERDRAIRRATFVDDRLWMLNESGEILSMRPGDHALSRHSAPGRVLDFCTLADRLVALVRNGTRTQLLAPDADWSPIADVQTEPDEIIEGLSCSKDRTVVLSNRRVHLLERGGANAIALSSPLKAPSVVTTLLEDGGTLYAGLDGGEWGGGLARIDLTSGAVSFPSKTVGDACSGPLFPGCDPVNGVAREPGRAGCIVAAVGLVHMFSHGRLVEVCGNDVRRIYYKPFTVETSWPRDPAKEPFRTVPFYGLVESSGNLWAVGTDGIYELSSGGKINFRKMPRFENVDGVDVSFEVPGLVLLRTSINGHVSLSGAVPILVSRGR